VPRPPPRQDVGLYAASRREAGRLLPRPSSWTPRGEAFDAPRRASAELDLQGRRDPGRALRVDGAARRGPARRWRARPATCRRSGDSPPCRRAVERSRPASARPAPGSRSAHAVRAPRRARAAAVSCFDPSTSILAGMADADLQAELTAAAEGLPGALRGAKTDRPPTPRATAPRPSPSPRPTSAICDQAIRLIQAQLGLIDRRAAHRSELLMAQRPALLGPDARPVPTGLVQAVRDGAGPRAAWAASLAAAAGLRLPLRRRQLDLAGDGRLVPVDPLAGRRDQPLPRPHGRPAARPLPQRRLGARARSGPSSTARSARPTG
jgi:hypothetical protein